MNDMREGTPTLLRRVQSSVILPTARVIFVAVAVLCMIAVGIGVLAAVYFQVATGQQPNLVPVPAPYVAPAKAPVDLSTVANRLRVPQNLRFVLRRGMIDRPLGLGDAIGYFDADTPNGLANAPKDFEIVDNKDSDFFFRRNFINPNGGGRSGLWPSQKLIDQQSRVLPAIKAPERQHFELSVIASDRWGNHSPVETVAVDLLYGPPAAPVPPAEEPREQLSDLQRLARDIALMLDPQKSPAYFDAYRRALQVPSDCAARPDDADFVAEFRQGFERYRAQLTPSLAEPFYAGICEAWQRAMNEEQNARNRADNARAAAERQNAAAEAETAAKRGVATIARNFTAGIVGGAALVFLVISLLLAFLAMENHSKALRETVAAIAKNRESAEP